MLTDEIIKNALPKEKRYKLWDGNGLFLMVYPTGSKTWMIKFVENGKCYIPVIGYYPQLSLSKARLQCQIVKLERERKKEVIRKSILLGRNPRKNLINIISFLQEIYNRHLAHREHLLSEVKACEEELKILHTYLTDIKKLNGLND